MNKFKKSAIIGGVWGLISGVFYLVAGFYQAFTIAGAAGSGISLTTNLLLLPAYLWNTLVGVVVMSLFQFPSDIPDIISFLLITSVIVCPILIGCIIGVGIGYLLEKFKKQ